MPEARLSRETKLFKLVELVEKVDDIAERTEAENNAALRARFIG